MKETILGYNPTFTPVPLARNRHDGWTPERQKQFLIALSVLGTVNAAARAVGMSRISAYKLREREGAESFAAAWDQAIGMGRAMQFDHAMECAINGVTTVRLRLGGVLDLESSVDRRQMMRVLRQPPPPRPSTRPPTRSAAQSSSDDTGIA
jgi:hypothetical protein